MTSWLGRLLPLLIGGGARLIAACIGLLATTVAARALGPTNWGVWVVLFAAFGWMQHVAEWGLRSVALVEGGRSGRVGTGTLSDLTRTRALVLLPAAGCLVGGVWLWRGDLGPAAAWVAAALAAIALNFDWVALVRGRPLLPGVTLIVRPSVALLVLLALPAPLTIDDVALATFAGFAAAAALGSLALAGLDADPPERRPAKAIPLLRSGTPYFLVTAANQLAASADLIAVAWVLGSTAAGTFGLVATLGQTATLGAQASAQWWLARSGRSDAPPLRRIVIETAWLGCLVGCAFALVGPPVTLVLFGDAWLQAAILLPSAGLFVALAHVTAVLGAIDSVRGHASAVAVLQLATQAVAWPAQLLVASHFGLAGVVLLRGAIEAIRVVMLGLLCLRGTARVSEA